MTSGDRCPKCGTGRMRVRTSRRKDRWQDQTLQCSNCQHKDRALVPAEKVWRRGDD
jgi:predicted RNA-binding Zn-ribbon protein involved in translation (DUF1610 family)